MDQFDLPMGTGDQATSRIDIHSHYVSRDTLDEIRRIGVRCESPVEERSGGNLFIYTPERAYGPVKPAFHDLDLRLAYMDDVGIDFQVLVPPPFTFYYWTNADEARTLMRLENDGTAEAIRHASGRFLGFGTVMLQDVRGSIRELERVKANGLAGIEIGSNVNGRGLDDPALVDFFAAVESNDMPLLIHPHNVAGQERMGQYHLRNLLGFPLDTTMAAAQLIFSGVMDRFPRIRICLGQAGGFLPYIIGRLDSGFQARPECRKNIGRRPSEYLDRFYFDSIIHSVRSSEFLIQTVGSRQVMLGTDFPFDMNATSPVEDLEQQTWLSSSQRRDISSQTAIRFLGLEDGTFA
jgi:aminocarboxymuconate-semialdehyde decarboxylase